jgi:hypothetical protein
MRRVGAAVCAFLWCERLWGRVRGGGRRWRGGSSPAHAAEHYWNQNTVISCYLYHHWNFDKNRSIEGLLPAVSKEQNVKIYTSFQPYFLTAPRHPFHPSFTAAAVYTQCFLAFAAGHKHQTHVIYLWISVWICPTLSMTGAGLRPTLCVRSLAFSCGGGGGANFLFFIWGIPGPPPPPPPPPTQQHRHRACYRQAGLQAAVSLQ